MMDDLLRANPADGWQQTVPCSSMGGTLHGAHLIGDIAARSVKEPWRPRRSETVLLGQIKLHCMSIGDMLHTDAAAPESRSLLVGPNERLAPSEVD